MTITFRTDIGAYTGKGSPLTKEEVDGNFYDLVERTLVLEEGGAFACESVDFTGNAITFNWSDDTTSGPFVLPVAMMTSRGIWANSATYFYLDLVSVVGVGTYLVLIEHTTPALPAAFDPGLEIDGDPVYQQIGESVDTSGLMEYRGEWEASTGYFVNDVILTPAGVVITLIGHTSGLAFDLYLTSGGNPVFELIAGKPFSYAEDIEDTEFTLDTTHVGKYLRIQNGANITFPKDVDFGSGHPEIAFRQDGDESVFFLGEDEDVILNPQRVGFDTTSPYQGAVIIAKYVQLNEWDLIGPHGEEVSA